MGGGDYSLLALPVDPPLSVSKTKDLYFPDQIWSVHIHPFYLEGHHLKLVFMKLGNLKCHANSKGSFIAEFLKSVGFNKT